MSIFEPSPNRDRMLALFRIVAALVFTTFGTMIVFGWPPPPVPLHFRALSQNGIGGLLEVVGGLAILVGFLTRPVAFVLAGEMAVAYFQFHAPTSFFPTANMGTAAIMYCGFFLYLCFAGPGAWSVDGVIARRRRAR
jgi:putative oxidoreductase